jgi:hypothetical protein
MGKMLIYDFQYMRLDPMMPGGEAKGANWTVPSSLGRICEPVNRVISIHAVQVCTRSQFYACS